MKGIRCLALSCTLALSLTACGGGTGRGAAGDQIQTVDESAPAHERLLIETGNTLVLARQQADVNATLQSEYTYGLAQAEISSLRQTVDTILWLKGEGETLDDLIGGAPYRTWDEIVGAGLGSDAPFYFEGLLLTIQGKDAEAEQCYQKAQASPIHTQRDFYYLRNMSVEELYALRDDAAALELEVWEEYTPRTVLLAERTGAEFAPAYHLSMAEGADDKTAYQCAVNALLANPMEGSLYGTAVCFALDAGAHESALELLDYGLWAFPEDGLLNFLAGALQFAAGNTDSARPFLETARRNGDSALQGRVDALYAQMGG